MNIPTVSVIMPAYNHERYVGEAIESVLNQTFTDFEFIIINDGSTDDTEQVIKTFDDPRINYYYQENIDAPKTLNRGLSLARGKYISVINSDDIYHAERLSFLVETAESQNAAFVFTDLEFVDESSKTVNHPSYQHVLLFHLKSNYLKTNSLQRTFFLGNMAITSSNFFFHSSAINEVGQFNSFRYLHDYDFALRNLVKYGDGFKYLPDKKYLFYRLHKKNTIGESPPEVRNELFVLLITMLPEFIRNLEDRALIESTKELFNRLHGDAEVKRSALIERIDVFTRLIRTYPKYMNDVEDKALVESAIERLELLNICMGIENTIGWKISGPAKWLYYRLPLSLIISAPVRWLYVKYLHLIKP